MYNKVSTNFLLYCMMAFAMLTWGVAWTSAKITNQYLNYDNLVFLRFLIGFITILPFLYKRKVSYVNFPKSVIFNIILTSILFFIYNQCFFMGTDLGKAGMGGVFVTTTNPIVTFIIISIISKEINLFKIFSVTIGMLGGIFILDIFNQGINAVYFPGTRYFVICSVTWGVMTIFMSYAQKKMDSIYYIACCYAVTSIIAIFFVDFTEILDYSKFDNIFYINFFFVCAAMSIGTSIYIYASYKLGPVAASTFIFSVPFIAIGTANIFINESIGFNVVIGGILSIISIYLVNSNLNLKK